MYQNIEEFYNTECAEEERLASQAGQVEYMTTMRYLLKCCPPKSRILDACAGTGIYAFKLAELGYEVVASDLVKANVEKMRRLNTADPLLAEICQTDILDLSRFENESFDIVLNLGAYYHLDDPARARAIAESLRVLKKDGIYFLSYINRFANFVGRAEDMNKDFGLFERFMKTGTVDGVFFAATPEAVERELMAFGLEVLHHIAADGPLFHLRDSINAMSSDIFKRFMKIHLATCETGSTLGCSEHGLVVCMK
jgi:SAM-dependent methyltransferase